MSVCIDVQQCGDEALVTVRGVVDRAVRDVAGGLVGLGQDCASVVDNRREAVLALPRGVHDLVTGLGDRARAERVTLVCDRLPERRSLWLAYGDTTGVQLLGDVPRRASTTAGPRAALRAAQTPAAGRGAARWPRGRRGQTSDGSA